MEFLQAILMIYEVVSEDLSAGKMDEEEILEVLQQVTPPVKDTVLETGISKYRA